MNSLVRQIVPDMPTDRQVKATRDPMAWYKVLYATKTLMVPTLDILKKNVLELDKFSEAVYAFSHMEFGSPQYEWDTTKLQLSVAKGLDIVEALKDLPNKARSRDSWIAVDIETRDLGYDNNKLLSIGFAYSTYECLAIYDIPIVHAQRSDVEVNSDVFDAIWQALNQPDINYIWHNGKFDCCRLWYMCQLKAHVTNDTMLQHYAGINERKGTHGLKDLGQLYLQAPPWDDELDKIKRDYCRKNKVPLKAFKYDYIPIETLIPYMQLDCLATYRLHALFNTLMRPNSKFIYEQLCRASNVFKDIELAGQLIDTNYLNDLEYKLNDQIMTDTRLMLQEASKYWDPDVYARETGAKILKNRTFNVQSPKQLQWLMQQLLGQPVASTSVTTINDLLRTLPEDSSAAVFLKSVLQVRKDGKYLDTYVKGFREVLCSDNRVRATYNLHGTETGRLSCSNPNMQNVPQSALIKNLIVAPKGTTLLQLDYSQAELRVLAMLSQDPAFIKIYQDKLDLHNATADLMFGPDAHKVKRNRQAAKTVNFGIAYGRGPGSIAATFGVSMSEAKSIIDRWFKAFPKAHEYIQGQRNAAMVGAPCVTLLGRERHFVLTNSEINHIQNEYINTPVQSLASDFTMLSLMDIYDYLQDKWRYRARIVSTVHDSIILEVEDKPEYLKEIANVCVQIMADTPKKYVEDCQVPFVADAEIGYKWGEMCKLDLETGLAIPKE